MSSRLRPVRPYNPLVVLPVPKTSFHSLPLVILYSTPFLSSDLGQADISTELPETEENLTLLSVTSQNVLIILDLR